MERPTRDTLAALIVGGITTAGLYYWLGGHGYVGLALVTGLCWGCALKLTLHVGHRYPAYRTGETWTDKRWTGLTGGVVPLVAFTVVNSLHPISYELRIGLVLLVVGAGLVAYSAGGLAILERVEDTSSAPSALETSYSTDDD